MLISVCCYIPPKKRMDMKSTPIDLNSYCFVAKCNANTHNGSTRETERKKQYKLLLYTNTFFDTHIKYVCDEGNRNHFPHCTQQRCSLGKRGKKNSEL